MTFRTYDLGPGCTGADLLSRTEGTPNVSAWTEMEAFQIGCVSGPSDDGWIDLVIPLAATLTTQNVMLALADYFKVSINDITIENA